MTVAVLDNHRFDEAALVAFLSARLDGFSGPCAVTQFQGGQSNPTFLLTTPGAKYVLRKQPPGVLLPSAHAVDREARIIGAMAGTVPVPRVRLACDDRSVIGTLFYVMDYVDGRVFDDVAMPGAAAGERRAAYLGMAEALGALHAADPQGLGLADYGRGENYMARQVARWSRQYREAGLEPHAGMDALLDWLPSHLPADDGQVSVVHGDFRLGNMMYAPDAPLLVAVLDWELSTLGHPLADLGYCVLPFRLPRALGGFADAWPEGVPDEAAFVSAYCARRGIARPATIDIYLIFSLFRWAAILAGVFRRALDGNAADSRAHEVGGRYRVLADAALSIARGSAFEQRVA